MANPQERDTVLGTAASASAEMYRARRQGDLIRASDGFRAPELPMEPRRYLGGGTDPHAPMAPYRPNPAPPADGEVYRVPRTWAYFRTATPGAARVGFPDRARTQGHLQASGVAWGRVGEMRRAALRPAVDGQDGPPTHQLGARGDTELIPRSTGPRWRYPATPTIRGAKAGASTAQ